MPNNDFYITDFSVKVLRRKLLYPFRTALGEHKDLLNLLFTLTLTGGLKGYGEAAIATHITGETVEATSKNLEIQGRELIGKNINDYLNISRKLHAELSQNKSAICAIEMALFDALSKKLNIPLWKMFGNTCKKLTTDITIVIADLKQTEESIKSFYQQGFRSFKVKIGADWDLDLKRVILIKKIAKRSKIYLDANQAYSAKETLLFLKLLKKAGIRPDLIEQPVKKGDWEGLRQITKNSDVPVCADESVRSVEDCMIAIKKKAVSAINIKLMKSGLIESKEIATLAHRAGLNLMIGGMMESSLAMTAAAHFAAGLGFFKYVDLDTPFFLKEGKKNLYLSPAGIYDLSKVKAGIGIDIL